MVVVGFVLSTGTHAEETVPSCSENRGATARAQCRLDSPESFNLGWLPGQTLPNIARATVHIRIPSATSERICTGTLVSTFPETRFTYILTAAHCFVDTSLTDTGSVSNVTALVWSNYKTNTCDASALSSKFSAGGGEYRSARLVHLNRSLDSALLLLDSVGDTRFRSDTNVTTAKVDPGDFQASQIYANSHHPNAADMRLHAGV